MASKTCDDIRREFIAFFEERGHTIVPSAPVVPVDDPTLMFTNAGMNQFKDVFLGTGSRPYTRAADTQKCIRVSGKHNDLEEVGRDTYHHTFFEMLGNWSFGDYFKKEAIGWAWELLTKRWGLPRERLYATVFGGDPEEGLEPDEEAAALWASETDIDPTHIQKFGKKDNFWEMGATGPCGPCSEIHIDLTPDLSGRSLVNAGDARVIEIWNLVFIQFNRDENGKLTPLPARHVDTGMGFERIVAVLQGKNSNYDTDVFAPVMEAIAKITGKTYTSKLGEGAGVDNAFRVVADHARMLTFSITDGAKPSNDGRGYVLRRLLRRAARFGRQQLGQTEPFIYRLVPTIVEAMGHAFPELKEHRATVEKLIREEEESFGRTLDRGIKYFWAAAIEAVFRAPHPPNTQIVGKGYEQYQTLEEVDNLRLADPSEYSLELVDRKKGTTQFSVLLNDLSESSVTKLCSKSPEIRSERAFQLYDTFGFPLDLTVQMAEERGLKVDEAGFEKLMAEAKEKARASAKQHVSMAISGELPATDDKPKYAGRTCSAQVLGWVKDNALVKQGALAEGEGEVGLVLDTTCFYAEQGGQVGDAGTITTETGTFTVETTQKLGDGIVHIGKVTQGALEVGQPARLEVSESRDLTRKNHTATHLMHWALREVLGEHVKQHGSVVDAERLRFDFDHNAPMTAEEIAEIERLVNEKIYSDLEVKTQELPIDEARKIPGVRAFFGEKYGDVVRVVSIGESGFSVEFCGGTHLCRTGEAGFFKIVGEEGIAKGVRRITAMTGPKAVEAVQGLERSAREAAQLLKASPDQLPARVAGLQDEIKKLRKQLEKGAVADVKGARQDLLSKAERVNGTALVVGALPEVPVAQMRKAADWLRTAAGSAAVCLATVSEGKPMLIAAMTDDLVKKGLKAGDLIKHVVPAIDGRGGGKPNLAQAGGNNAEGVPQALELAAAWMREKLG